MPATVQVESRDQVRTLTIRRPSTRNALNLEVLQELIGALEDAQAGADRVLVLQGEGGHFSSGGDIQDMAARRGAAVATAERLRSGLVRIVELLTHHPLPVLARVDGDCLGAGLGLAMAADAILATASSRFGFPFVKVALIPDTATSWTLSRLVGAQHARRLLLTGELITGTEALGLGLVSQLSPDTKALDGVLREWVERLRALPAGAVADAKRLFWLSLQQPLSTATLNEAILQGIRFTTPEHAAAVDAFLARKKG